MFTFKQTPARQPDGTPVAVTIVSGPVIIENGQVLLDKHGGDGYWKFPGGALLDDVSPRQHAIKQGRLELGLELEPTGEPFIIAFNRHPQDLLEHVILIHYPARRLNREIKPSPDIEAWAWFALDKLPLDSAPNIKPAVEYFTRPYK